MYFSGPAVHGIGVDWWHSPQSIQTFQSHSWRSMLGVCCQHLLCLWLGWCWARLHQTANTLPACWGPLKLLQWNSSAGIEKLWYMEGLDSVGWFLARLLLHLIRSRRTYALHLTLPLQTLVSSFWSVFPIGDLMLPPIPSQDLLGVFLCRDFHSFSGLFLTKDAGHLVLAHCCTGCRLSDLSAATPVVSQTLLGCHLAFPRSHWLSQTII